MRPVGRRSKCSFIDGVEAALDVLRGVTIVYRGGAFRVGRATYDWDTRAGIGRCDVNFLTGKASVSHSLAKGRSIRGKFVPIKLADWSDEGMPTGCN
jgi:hypothetical protein